MDSDENILHCLAIYGIENIRKLQMAVNSCENIDILDEKMLQVVGSSVGLSADDLRMMYVGVAGDAPLLLRSSFGCTEPDEIILFPPVKTCIMGCLNVRGEQNGFPIELSYHNEAAQGILFDLGGKTSKTRRFSTRCWKCGSRYLYDMYLDNKTTKTYHYYCEKRKYVRVSQDVLWSRSLCTLLVESILHCRATFEGFTTMFREAFGVKGGWNNHCTAAAYFAYEIEEQLRETSMLSSGFPSDTDLDSILPELDAMRCKSHYAHEPTEKCKRQGCGIVWAVDGIWKIGFRHCAFVQENIVENVRLINYPCVCPQEPLRQSGELFCEQHAALAREFHIPTKRKHVTANALKAAAYHLQGMEDLLQSANSQIVLPASSVDPAEEQGTQTLDDSSLLITETAEATESEALLTFCSKDTGEFRNHPHRSRGYLFVVRACGHIDTFSPLYKSESPSQVFLIVMAWLYTTLKGIPYHRWSSVFIAYDAMCKLDAMKATKEPFPLPAPFDTMWNTIGKVIDKFHLSNHVGHKCHTLYNPQRILDAHPELKYANTQACEQTFAWLGRYKFALLKMSKFRQLFFLHRLITRRNRFLCKISRAQPLDGEQELD